MNQKECININVKFSKGLSIFDDHYGYPEIDDQEQYDGPTGKVIDIQGPQAHAGRNFFVPEGKDFSFDIDECPYLHIAIKAEEGTSTCLMSAASMMSVEEILQYCHENEEYLKQAREELGRLVCEICKNSWNMEFAEELEVRDTKMGANHEIRSRRRNEYAN